MPAVSNDADDEFEPANYHQTRFVTTPRTRRGEPVDSLTFMTQNIRSALRAPDDPVGGTIRDLKEHYEDCATASVKVHPKAPQALPKFPPGDPRNKKPEVCEVCEGTETIFDYGGPFSCGACTRTTCACRACTEKPAAA